MRSVLLTDHRAHARLHRLISGCTHCLRTYVAANEFSAPFARPLSFALAMTFLPPVFSTCLAPGWLAGKGGSSCCLGSLATSLPASVSHNECPPATWLAAGSYPFFLLVAPVCVCVCVCVHQLRAQAGRHHPRPHRRVGPGGRGRRAL